MITQLTVAVTGATGQQGGHLTRLLLKHGHRVKALTRNKTSDKAKALKKVGAEVVEADLENGQGLDLSGVDALFLVTTPFENGAKAEVIQAQQAGKAAKSAQVPHVVYSSVTLPMTQSPIEHFAAKGQAERELKKLELPLTIIGNPPFIDNLIAPWHLPLLRQGHFSAAPSDLQTSMQMVAVIDIAGMVAYAIEHRDEVLHQRIDIASDEVSGQQMLDTLNQSLALSLVHQPKSFAELSPRLGKLFANADQAPSSQGGVSQEKFDQKVVTIDQKNLHATYPEVGWHSFADWVALQNWEALLTPKEKESA